MPSDPFKFADDDFGDLGNLPVLIMDVKQELEGGDELSDIDTLVLYENDHVIEAVRAFVKKYSILEVDRS